MRQLTALCVPSGPYKDNASPALASHTDVRMWIVCRIYLTIFNSQLHDLVCSTPLIIAMDYLSKIINQNHYETS